MSRLIWIYANRKCDKVPFLIKRLLHNNAFDEPHQPKSYLIASATPQIKISLRFSAG